MVPCDDQNEFWDRANLFLKSIDHYPNHWLFHFMHAVHVMGLYLPGDKGDWWLALYQRLVSKLHLWPESKDDLDRRLNADEDSFRKQQAA